MDGTKCLVLDLDNCVLLDEKTGRGSEEIKDEAWYVVFPEYSREELDSAMREAKSKLSLATGQADRQDVVREICRYFHVVEDEIGGEVVRRCMAFNQEVQKGIAKIEISEQTRGVLGELSQKIPIYVNTATPQETAIESLSALGLMPLLRGVYGRPGTKLGNIKVIMDAEGLAPNQILFVDDQTIGWSVAQQVGCNFIGIYTARNKLWLETPQPFPIIHSLSELPSLL